MPLVAAYFSALLVFAVVDAIWLTLMGPAFYRPVLGDLLASSVRIAPAIAFYLAYPVGIVVFGVMPGLRSESWASAFGHALLFGALAYATYDLTNYATLRVWSAQVTLIDIAYGAFASGVAAVASYLVVANLARWLGAVP